MSNDGCTNENTDRFSIVMRKQTKLIVHPVASIVTMVRVVSRVPGSRQENQRTNQKANIVEKNRICAHIFFLPFSRLDHSQLLTSSVHILNKAGVHMLHKHIVVGEVGVNFLTSLPILFLQNSCNCRKSGKQFNCRFTLLQNFNCISAVHQAAYTFFLS